VAPVEGMAAVPLAVTGPSTFDKYFMPPHLAPPPGYLSIRRAVLSLPHAPGCEGSKHRKKVEMGDWQVRQLCRSCMSLPVQRRLQVCQNSGSFTLTALSAGGATDHLHFSVHKISGMVRVPSSINIGTLMA
jgi:hypothetical protein